MCAIFGALLWDASSTAAFAANRIMNRICVMSMERGRDGRGWHLLTLPRHGQLASVSERDTSRSNSWPARTTFFGGSAYSASLIGNVRAEPTTEFVMDKQDGDQQPYTVGPWTIVHNGTVANDKELRTGELATSIDSAAIAELLAGDHMMSRRADEVSGHFAQCISKIKGSYAILAVHAEHPGLILVACNYRPIWFAKTEHGTFFASSAAYFPEDLTPRMVQPYTAWAFGPDMEVQLIAPATAAKRALVVCSGGLDSVVAARAAQAEGYDINLLHFRYGSRAEGPEVEAVQTVADALGVECFFMSIPIYDPSDSPLLQADSEIAGGEAGAEFAHEWVPARNLVMLSIASALAEAKGYDTLVLGNNLEEAGAYPDNEPEFINRFNALLPFAVADGKRLRVIMPVGNLMKHEIVALGHKLGAPMQHTWSCYRAGEQHCGTCGPCFMRRTAFKINNLPEVITYQKEK